MTDQSTASHSSRLRCFRFGRLFAGAVILALAACGSPSEEGDSAAADNALVVNTAVSVPENAVTPEASEVLPHVTPPGEPTPADAIPVDFRGRWGLGVNDCDPTRDDAKGLMVVASNKLTFYESRGRPTQVSVLTPDKITLDLDFTGEGQTWTRTTTFTLLDGGRTLVREETDPATALRYHRCNA